MSQQPTLPTYRGRVVDESGNPVANAAVHICCYEGEPSWRAYASGEFGVDESGRFAFASGTGLAGVRDELQKRMPEARCLVVAEVSGRYGVCSLPLGVESAITLLPSKSVDVSLVTVDGHPVSGVTLRPLELRFGGHNVVIDYHALQSHWQAISGDDGLIRWPNVPSGATIVVNVIDDRFAMSQVIIDCGSEADKRAVSVTVYGGGVIEGRVIFESTGTPMAQVHVTAHSDGQGLFVHNFFNTVTGEDGTYRLPSLPPGEYTVHAAVTDRSKSAGWVPGVRVPVNVIDAATTTVEDLIVVPSTVIRGRVTIAGAPVEWVQVHAHGIAPGGASSWGLGISGKDGSYVIDAYPRPVYEVSAVSGDLSASAAITAGESREVVVDLLLVPSALA